MGPDTIVVRMLPGGRRLSLRHGPIDLIVEAMGNPADVEGAYEQATVVFPNILGELAGELSQLRAPADTPKLAASGQVARTMIATAKEFSRIAFVTPMICVAGAVAEYVLASMVRDRSLDRAYVNNGGDIALYLAQGQGFDVGVCANPSSGAITSVAQISERGGIGGIATSGRRGRSHSLGIADAVTVLAATAAEADAAATLIANAVDLPGHEGIVRTPANQLSPDSDLANRLVTIDVASLTCAEVSQALSAGQLLAQDLIGTGQIIAAYGSLQGFSFSTQDCGADAIRAAPKTNHTQLERNEYA
ncbi:MAG: UPF0280 family protein [Paracoccaceae bacterium]